MACVEDYLPLAAGLLRFGPRRESRRDEEAGYENRRRERCLHPGKLCPRHPIPFRNGAVEPPRVAARLATYHGREGPRTPKGVIFVAGNPIGSGSCS